MNKLFSLKKSAALLTMALTFFMANHSYAEHSDDDKYEAMCQMSGGYADVKYPSQQLPKNKVAHLVKLVGACGEKPNILVVDTLYPLFKNAGTGHRVQVFESQGKGLYWKMVFYGDYEINPQGNIINRWIDKPDRTSFVKVNSTQPLSLIVERYCSAKKGAPIFPSAEGNMFCDVKNGIEGNIFEIAFEDYLKYVKK